MPPFNPIQTNFTAGVLSPRMKGRVDVARYSNGVQTLENFLGHPQGPIYRRSGTRFVGAVRDESAKTRIYEFQFSNIQNYIIEFGNLYCRFFKDGGPITLTAQNISGITKANPAVLTYVGADTYANGDKVLVSGVLGMTEVNNREFTVANVNVGANTFELSGVDSTAYTTYSSGGTVAEIYQITTPYLTADIPTLFFTQSADTLYVEHVGYAPQKITRSAHTSWTITPIAFSDGPYLTENIILATTLTAAAATGAGIVITASAVTGINGGQGFLSTDVGRLLRIRNGTAVGWAKIVGLTDTTHVTADIQTTVPTAAVSTWRLGAWSNTTGFPSCAVFHEQRLWFSNTTNQPQTSWGSKTGDYENFAPTDLATLVADDNAVTYTIVSNQVNPIFWMESGAVLLLGTQGQEWQVKSGSLTTPITPTNLQVTPQTSYGSRQVRSRKVGTAVLFVQRSGRKVRELLYNYQIDGFQAKDLTLLSEHITREGGYIVDVAYQQEPDSVYWAVRNDGKLAGMLYIPEQEIVGWNLQLLGGAFAGGNAVVEYVASIPTTDGTSDQLWMVVKRTINGATHRYIEYMEVPFNPTSTTDKNGAFFVDAGLTYDGSAATVISGLGHLEGETVSICANGAVRPAQVVTAGKITLTTSATKVSIGLGYTSKILTLPVEGGAAFGTAQGKIKRTGKVTVRLLNTLGLKFGVDLSNLRAYAFRKMGDPMDSSAPLFTGDVLLELEDTYRTEGTYYIVQDDPLPMTILSLMPETVVAK